MAEHLLPNFNTMATGLHSISAQQISLATQLQRLKNVPALNDRIQIRQALEDLKQGFNKRAYEIHCHLDSMYGKYPFFHCITTYFVL